MTGFKRILFPVDFSAQSKAVTPSVAAMAARFGAEVDLLHVIQLPVSSLPASRVSPLDLSALRTDAAIALDRFAAERFSAVRGNRQIREGDPAGEIVRYASEHQISLVMMPTHGYGPFRELLLGSVTAKVLHQAACPVWTGVHAEEIKSHPPCQWRHILCAVDDVDGKDVPVLQWAMEFARSQEADLRLVHAVAGAEAVFSRESDPGMHRFLFEAARLRLAKLQAEAGTALDVVLMPGSPGGAVRRAALEIQADLIVVGRGAGHKGWERLRNHAYAIIREAPCPVISI